MVVRTHTHVEVLLSPFLAVNPMGLTNGHSELVNGFYVDSWCVFTKNTLQENAYNYIGGKECLHYRETPAGGWGGM